jgi:hypothetical protein
VYNPPPYVIYTNEELKISTKNTDYTFPPFSSSEKKALITSKLNKLQILELKAKALRDDFKNAFDFANYLDWLALAIEGLLTPLVVIGICLGIRRKVVQRRSDRKLAKLRRQRNQRETRALLRESRL